MVTCSFGTVYETLYMDEYVAEGMGCIMSGTCPRGGQGDVCHTLKVLNIALGRIRRWIRTVDIEIVE